MHPKVFIYIKIWKFLFLGDIKLLYISNNRSNLNIALIFLSWAVKQNKTKRNPFPSYKTMGALPDCCTKFRFPTPTKNRSHTLWFWPDMPVLYLKTR
jgi:hypothetical protein